MSSDQFDNKYVPALKQAGVSDETVAKLRELNKKIVEIPGSRTMETTTLTTKNRTGRATALVLTEEARRNFVARDNLEKEAEQLLTTEQRVSVNKALGLIPSAAKLTTGTLGATPRP